MLLAMTMILARSASAQGLLALKSTSNWLAAIHATIGPGTPAGWFLDLDAEGMEVYSLPDRSLVLVDRTPMVEAEGQAYLRKPVQGLGGTRLSLVSEVEDFAEDVLHGAYSGLLGGKAVVMDQYVQMRNCVPVAIVRVITRVNGLAPAPPINREELVASLLGDAPEAGTAGPGLCVE